MMNHDSHNETNDATKEMNSVNVQNIPAALRENALWCVWRRFGNDKKPYNPISGKFAQSNNPNTFVDFATAYRAYTDFRYDGVGIGVFNNICAIDIDHCIHDGEISDMAKDIIAQMNSYTEISPSGNGIRIICTVSDFQYDTDCYYIHNKNAHLEIYVAGATNKFVTITGNAINRKDVADGTAVLPKILEKYMQRPKKEQYTSQCHSLVQSDADYLSIGLDRDEKLKAYWNGARPKESESENDCGFMSKLLYWTNGDIDRAIAAFLGSPYAAQKDEKHRKKLDRKDYLFRTAQAAMPSRTAAADHEQWKLEQARKKKPSAEPEQPDQQPKKKRNIISAAELQKADLPPVRYLIDDILPEGISLICAASKTGKSWFVLDMGLKIASGEIFMHKQTHKTSVLYFALEDGLARLKERLNTVLDHSIAPDNFYFETEVPNLDNGFLDVVEEYIKYDPNIRLIIIDTLQKIRGQALPRESAYQQDYREIGRIKSYMDKRGISVCFVHHTRKQKDDEDPFNMISGTNGIMGAADTVHMITKKARKDKDAILHITGRDVQQQELKLFFRDETCRWEVVGEVAQLEKAAVKKKYRNNPIVHTIVTLLKESPNGTWKGNAKALMDEGRRITKTEIATSSTALGKALNSTMDEMLRENDHINHEPKRNGTAGATHHFSYCPVIVDEESAQDDEEIVEF